MSENERKPEVHRYDDIEELDNPIPEWFRAFFYAGVLFGLAYYCYFELWGGPSLRDEYERAVARNEAIRLEKGQAPKASGEELLALLRQPESVRKGGGQFRAKCASCHGAEGQGGIGPNLTDRFWIHGGKIEQVRDTIEAGVAAKGMPPWGGIFSATELNTVAAYVHSLKGTRPAGAKAPQGELEKD